MGNSVIIPVMSVEILVDCACGAAVDCESSGPFRIVVKPCQNCIGKTVKKAEENPIIKTNYSPAQIQEALRRIMNKINNPDTPL